MENPTVLRRIEHLQGKDVVVLLGKTRAGKSTFINDAHGMKVVKTTTSMESDTNEISYVNQPVGVDGRDIILVDTIGLGGSGEGHDRASFTSTWLRILHPGINRTEPLTPTVKGILYFIDIMDGAMNEDNIRNLETFKALVGEEVLESVIFVTTKWVTNASRDIRRGLEDNFVGWAEKTRRDFPGASILRLDDTTGRIHEEYLEELSSEERTKKEQQYHDNAMTVLRQLLTKPATQPLRAQKEMYDGGKGMKAGQTTLGETTIRHLCEDLKRVAGGKDKQVERTVQTLKNTAIVNISSQPETIAHKLRQKCRSALRL